MPSTIELNFDDDNGVFTVYPSDANGGAYVPLADYEAIEAERDALLEACKETVPRYCELFEAAELGNPCDSVAVGLLTAAIAKAEGE